MKFVFSKKKKMGQCKAGIGNETQFEKQNQEIM